MTASKNHQNLKDATQFGPELTSALYATHKICEAILVKQIEIGEAKFCISIEKRDHSKRDDGDVHFHFHVIRSVQFR